MIPTFRGFACPMQISSYRTPIVGAARRVLVAALALILVPAFLSARAPVPSAFRAEGYYDGAEFHLKDLVAPGVLHTFDSFSTGPMTINTLAIDTTRPDLVIETEKEGDRLTGHEALDKMVKRLHEPLHRPVAAINADFWGTRSIPIGLFIDRGMIWKNPGGPRSVFAFDDKGNFFIGPATWSVALKGSKEGEALTIDRINTSTHAADPQRVVAYTWPHGESSPAPTNGQTRIVLTLLSGEWLPNAPAPVMVKSIDTAGTTSLDQRTVVLLLESAPPAWLKVGARLALDARFGGLPGKVVGAVGGGPQLLEDGKVCVFEAGAREDIGRNFITDLHPRTAIGIKADGKTLVFVVVDGRQPGRSIGINLPDLAEWMQKQGCVIAMNLDGGGSSSMTIRDEIVNFPSDAGGPRSVSNALIVFRTAPIGPLSELRIQPRNAVLPPKAKVQLKAAGYDAAREPVSLDAWSLTWSTGSRRAKIDAAGLLDVGSEMGVFDVSVAARPSSGAARPVTGAATPNSTTAFQIADAEILEVVPSAILMETGGEENIRLSATAADGRRFGDPALWEITVPPFLRFVPAEGRLKAVAEGAGYLTARLGAKSVRVPVAVDRFKETLAYSFDTLASDTMREWIEGIRYKPDATSVVLDSTTRKEGAASWKFTYAMDHGGVTKIALPLNVTLPGRPLGVGLWVRGDGKQQWLRGELRDASNRGYYLDFTNATTGINWAGEWRFVQASLVSPTAMGGYRGPMTPPLTLKSLYVAQAQEAAKKDGEILLDGLYALDIPDALAAEMK